MKVPGGNSHLGKLEGDDDEEEEDDNEELALFLADCDCGLVQAALLVRDTFAC